MKKRTIRIYYVLGIVFLISALFFLFIKTFNENLLFYRSPSQISVDEFPEGYVFRIGGMVVDDSLYREKDSMNVKFEVTDFNKNITVHYSGMLPDLFREGQGVVIKGKLLRSGIFKAEEVLAKHDETYMPPEVSESLHIDNNTLLDTTKSLNIE